MKDLLNLDKGKKILNLAERAFDLRQAERENRMTVLKEEIDKWRQSQRMKVVSSKKYR